MPDISNLRRDSLFKMGGLRYNKREAFSPTELRDTIMEDYSASNFNTITELGKERIQRYLASNEAYDKAGAYAIQGRAGAFVQHIEGSYSGVMGLPLFETIELLQSFGHPVP